MKSRILMFFTVVSIGIAGCADPCADVNCMNGGVCNDGSCTCPEGFTGEFCQTTVDPCDDVTCENGGVCLEGDCICDQGYEGVNCETESRAKFIGVYYVNENCQGNNYTYVITIAASGLGAEYVTLSNLFDTGHTLNCLVDGNSITILSQSVSGMSYTGTGTISNTILTMAFQVMSGGDSMNCNITGTQ